MSVSPQQFSAAFCAVADSRQDEIVTHWEDCTLYTKTIFGMLPIVAVELGLAVCPEYYTLDAIFYHEKDTVHFSESTIYAKRIEVAFEHENILAGSEVEMNKLQLFSAPLKILVTYANDENRQQYLDRYTKIIRWADAFGDIGTLRRQLVIFGELWMDRPIWRSFVYEAERFIEI